MEPIQGIDGVRVPKWNGKVVKVGDFVTRWLAGQMPQVLKITELTETLVTCELWTFDRHTGAEVDEELGWGPPPKLTGSFIENRLVQ